MKRIRHACMAVLMAVSMTAKSQDMIFLKAIPIYAWGNSDMGGAAYAGEIRGQLGSFGLKLDYAKGHVKESDPKHYYKYLDEYRVRGSWRFSGSSDGEMNIGHLLNLGYTHTNAYKHHLFQAVDPTLRPPATNPDETQRLLSVYYTDMKISASYMSFGYERLKKHDFQYAGWVKHILLDPFGFVLGSFTSYEEGGMFYTSSLYFDLLVLTPNGCSYSPKEYYNTYGVKPASNDLVVETMYKNKVGFRMGYEISTLSLFGLTFGIEAGMMPGIFHYSSDYGKGFPQDNIYFGAKAGFAFGYAPKN